MTGLEMKRARLDLRQVGNELGARVALARGQVIHVLQQLSVRKPVRRIEQRMIHGPL